jgi:hypothetical protein
MILREALHTNRAQMAATYGAQSAHAINNGAAEDAGFRAYQSAHFAFQSQPDLRIA